MELISHRPKNADHHEPRETTPRMFLVTAARAAQAIAASATTRAPRIPLRHAGLSTLPANLHARANQ